MPTTRRGGVWAHDERRKGWKMKRTVTKYGLSFPAYVKAQLTLDLNSVGFFILCRFRISICRIACFDPLCQSFVLRYASLSAYVSVVFFFFRTSVLYLLSLDMPSWKLFHSSWLVPCCLGAYERLNKTFFGSTRLALHNLLDCDTHSCSFDLQHTAGEPCMRRRPRDITATARMRLQCSYNSCCNKDYAYPTVGIVVMRCIVQVAGHPASFRLLQCVTR